MASRVQFQRSPCGMITGQSGNWPYLSPSTSIFPYQCPFHNYCIFICISPTGWTGWILHGEGPRSRCYGHTTALRLLVQPPVLKMSSFFYQVSQVMEHQGNEIDRGKPTTRRKTCPSVPLSTTNHTWTDPGSNSGLRSGRPATIRLSHGTATDRP
jgi:hypothetical protein